MNFANILLNITSMGLFVLICSLVICIYIVYFDVFYRKIPNKLIILLTILAIVWHLYEWPSLFPLEIWLQMLLIVGAFVFIYNSWSIGGGDIKLILALSVFFLSYRSPFIFIGNVAILTLIFLSWYIIGNILRTINKEQTQKEIYDFLCEKYNYKVLFTKIFNFSAISLWISVIFIVTTIQYALYRYVFPTIPWISFILVGTGGLMFFFISIPLLHTLYRWTYKKGAIFLSVFLVSVLFVELIQSNTLYFFIQNTLQTMLFIGSISVVYRLFLNIYHAFLVIFDRKLISTKRIKKWDILNIYWSNFLYKHIQKDIFAFTGVSKDTLHLDKDRKNELSTQLQKYPNIHQLFIQNTLPYAIFIVLGFLITMMTDIHLAGTILHIIKL